MLQWLWRFRLTLMLTSVGALAGALRFVGLAQPRALVFDELYYARGAYSLLELGYEGKWEGENGAFAEGDFSGLTVRADNAVHPPLGKWMIALGIKAFGPTPFGWRVSSAVIGTITVILVALIAHHLFRSVLWGGVAGLFLAIDGEHIVLSRTALLDIFLTFFVVVAFGFLLLDRRRHRRLLATKAAEARERLGLGPDQLLPGFGPRTGVRWWRLAAIVSLGLATGVKWSGLYFAFVFLLLSFIWEVADRRRADVGLFSAILAIIGLGGALLLVWLGLDDLRWICLYFVAAFLLLAFAWEGIRRRRNVGRSAVWGFTRMLAPMAIASVILLPAAYVASYSSWFISDASFMRHWAVSHEDEGISWLPESARSFVEYHQDTLRFHNNLDISKGVEHSYAANPWGFLVQAKPTAFHWKVVEKGEGDPPSETKYVSEIMAIGNPLIWWTGAIAFLWALGRSIFRRDLLAAAVVVGIVAGWLPWTLFPDRVMFTFYSVAFSPWVVLTLVWALRRIAQPPRLKGGWSRRGTLSVGGFVAATLLVAGYFLPIWTGQWIPNSYWHAHVFQCDRIPEFDWI